MIQRFFDYFEEENTMKYSKSLYDDIIKCLGGKLFNDGLFTVFKKVDIEKWNGIVKETFADFESRPKLFGYDWLGRCFGIDDRSSSSGNVLMYEIGTADILEIPCRLEEFLNKEIPCHPEECLSLSFFNDWLNASNQHLEYGKCAGYRVPLFLNGADVIDNLEVCDMEVYWGLIGQVIQRI